MRSEALPRLFSREVRRVHCVGVGGMGVAPLAVYLSQSGFSVTGEDDGLTEDVGALLAREGVAVRGMPDDCELVVYSSAISKAHPAYAAAMARGLPLVRRGEMLAEVVRGKKLVAVCGSHGKTTTTAMLVAALREANFPAGYVLGGLFADDTPPARVGSNDWVVAEVDESDGTIERFSPEITVCVNLDWDHPDQYRTREDLERAFRALFERTRGVLLVSDACAWSGRVAGRRGAENADGAERRRAEAAPYFTFGTAGEFSGAIEREDAERMTLGLGGRFSVKEAVVRAGGEFNAGNAMAALAALQLMGVVLAPRLLAEFAGVRRRQAVLHAEGGVTVIEDYAHHPAEIRALLASLRRRVGGEERLLVVFQPHRFSRTAQFKAEFAAALAGADRLHLLDVYPAGEAPIAGGTTADIHAELKRAAPALPVNYFPADDAEFLRALARDMREGDLVVFVGAGDIDRKARAWIDTLKGAR